MFMPMIFIFSGFVGLFVMPMNWTVNLYFINFAPWRLYIVIITLVNALNALVFSFLPESPKFLMTMNKADDALDILRNMFEINTKNIKEVNLKTKFMIFLAKYQHIIHGHLGISSLLFVTRNNYKRSIDNKRIREYFENCVESNDTYFYSTVFGQHR